MKKTMLLLGFMAVLGTQVSAQAVPASLQCALLKKIFSLDKTLAAYG
jgi:hypothetical protein